MQEQSANVGAQFIAPEQEQTNKVITIVLTADNHLGYTIPGQHPRKREEQRQRQRHAFQQATDFAIGQGVDLFLQAGDLFDTARPDEQDRSFVAARLAQLKQAGIRVFALGGVHDIPAETHAAPGDAAIPAPAPQLSYASLGALHYFAPTPGAGRGDNAAGEGEQLSSEQHILQPEMLDLRGTLVGICGLGVVPGQQGDPLAHVRVDNAVERAAIPLLLLHAPIEGVGDGKSALDTQAQVSRASIAAHSAFRYILSGYHHAFTRLTIGQSDVIVAGATQHIDFNDPDDEPGFVFLGIAADGVRWCRHISIDGVQLRRLVIHVSELWPDVETQSIAPGQSPTERILEQLRPLCSPDAMVQLRLEGELTRQRYHQLDLNQLWRYGEEHTFALAIDDSTLAFLPDSEALARVQSTSLAASEIEERLSPREELITLADEWIAAAEDEEEQQALVATKEELLATLWNL
ncbi:MAG TPA: metallophosphoesterase [Ktedonobacteraceae bacterium]|nr:metallophosphoesterase [Ktedonobacteraceae bacterium]